VTDPLRRREHVVERSEVDDLVQRYGQFDRVESEVRGDGLDDAVTLWGHLRRSFGSEHLVRESAPVR
jgi:hypothetical protein